MVRGSAPSRLAALRPCRSASYSAWLFEPPKPNLTIWSKSSPSGEIRTIPKPEPLEFAAPSTYSAQHFFPRFRSVPLGRSSLVSMSLFSGANSAMKSASTCPLIAVLVCSARHIPKLGSPFGYPTVEIRTSQ